MFKYQFVNGTFKTLEETVIPATDLAIVRGYGIFDFFQIKEGCGIFMEEHVARFFRSAELLRLPLPYSQDEISKFINQLIRINHISFAGLKIVATGGHSPDGLHIGSPNLVILAQEYHTASDQQIKNGVKLITQKYVRTLPEVKSTSYTMAVYLTERMQKEQAIEPLYYDTESVSECARSNIFAVFGDHVITPKNHILKGITRNHIINILHDEKISIEEQNLPLEDLLKADEVFISGTTKKALGVNRIENHLIGDGKPGVVTMKVREILSQHETKYIKRKQKEEALIA